MAREKGEHTNVNGTNNTTDSKPNTYFGYTPTQIKGTAWDCANLATVTFLTSTSIAALQSPFKAWILNLSKDGSFSSAYKGGVFGFVRAAYSGYTASLSSSAIRSAYVTGAKNNRPVELMTEGMAKEENLVVKDEGLKKALFRAKMGYVTVAALGEIFVTQIPESLSLLRKIPRLLPPNFKWYTLNNAYQLMSGGFMARYLSGVVSFTSLCIIEDQIAEALPIKDKKTKHFMAGALSGAIAATCSYPFAAFKDYTLVRATVNNGKLVNKKATSIIVDMTKQFWTSPKEVANSVVIHALKQLPLRIALVAGIFGTVGFVNETCGPAPLDEVIPERFRPSSTRNQNCFFSNSSSSVVIEEVEPTKEEAVEQRQTGPK
ncbi:hypothetical protein [Legionella fallonii]|uniref:Periplasmic ligand-binding sensor domain protein n=1 Tax=Legionella fallonii LLAP-10 TaxID=1212491 RepID=A0A098G7K4_9GAMM|nr:hypothetical protein [Legionella fallonii]CEG58437.1 conserved protein of unknown function [Legionella fallonii LLAP-10]